MLSGEAICIDLCFGEGAVCKRNSMERSIVHSLKSRFENCFGSSESSSILSKKQINLCPVRKTTETEIFHYKCNLQHFTKTFFVDLHYFSSQKNT